jgi:glycosyl transferase, family 25
VRAYVINLARCPERRSHMTKELRNTGLDYEFVDAIDGRDLNPDDTQLADRAWRAKMFSANHAAANLGASLSHLAVYRKVLENGDDHALVLEDDVAVPSDICNLVEAVAEQMTGAEIVLLHFFSPRCADRGEPLRLSRQNSVQLPEARLLVFPVKVNDITSAAAYLITREACERMARAVLPVRVDSDRWEHFRQGGALSHVRCVLPMPVTTWIFGTTISSRSPNSLHTRFRDAARRVPFLNQALTLRRQRRFAPWYRVQLVDDLADMTVRGSEMGS